MDIWYASVITPLSSIIGQDTFYRSSHLACDRLYPNFEEQEHLSFCGITCASILLKTLRHYLNWSQTVIYSSVAQNHMSNGINLDKLSDVLERCDFNL
ncbi:unnamed protein product [Rotaria magnacalcarata]|uniref:Uncharacterized protein n=1 Tax=Rotaria magnacalcarata TaxID=392030 RepID=A0A8S2KUJ5_9BILA|nr:unnamed protein product [Rotaria magnacalcarata]